MKGFDLKFNDFPDYIIGITKEIWEDRGLRRLDQYYAEDVVMRLPLGIVRGRQAVLDGTLATLAEFPDRQLLAEDVIWSGDEEAGFLSSHRITSTGTHLGHGPYGAPTGRKIRIRALADCAAKDNAIYDEWLVRDGAALVEQLGIPVADYARGLIAREGGAKTATRPFTPDQDVFGGYASRGNDHPAGADLAEILTAIMDKDLAVIPRRYDRAVRGEYPGDRWGWGIPFVEQVWMDLRTAFPSARFEVHHVIGRDDPFWPPRAAVRWSLTGRHDGWGRFGAPTGAEVHVMGITHAEFGPWGLRREYTLWDEIAIWKQILLHTGLHD